MTAGKKKPPVPPAPGRRKANPDDFEAQHHFAGSGTEERSSSVPGGQFGTDSKPRSMSNRIAESGMNFVRNVLDNPTRHDMPVLELKSQHTGEFDKAEPSEVHEYKPTWEGQQQPPQFGGSQQEQNFTRFQSAIRQWNANEAAKAFEKPKRQRANVVFMPEKRRSGWRWIILLMVIGGLGVGGLYTHRFVNDKIISDFKAKINKKTTDADFDEKDPDVIQEEEPRRKKRYNRMKKRRLP